MDWLLNVDWESVLVPDTPLLEIVVRGTLVYLFLFLMLRIFKRQSGTLGITDLLVVVLIADAAQNAMADDYRAVPDGMLLIATIMFWNYALEWLGYRFPAMEKLLHPAPLPLIRKGRMIRRNMRRELITEDEMMSQLRHQGIKDIAEVKEACLEGDGKISIVKYEGKPTQGRKKEGAVG